ncbi:hypothetical protein [Chitinolyticbacter meiyuanensis]|uniref:hypothetical protein n=1 Tax=Chitinolyticbacter meiyuanensis TaxID=682798 RepID=UPI0011E5A46E|nr:hypothetical protein [Chitinolyticbacter meiyuanensis]
MSPRASIVGLMLSLAFLGLITPWGLYAVGLHVANGRPELSQRQAVALAWQVAWESIGGVGQPVIRPLNPYTYWRLDGAAAPECASAKLAWLVARRQVSEHRRYDGAGWWHFSGIALTIWLTRHWTEEQLLSKAIEDHLVDADLRRSS